MPGELFTSVGIVYLDPNYATDLLKPLVDHRLGEEAWLRTEVTRYMRERPGGGAACREALLYAARRLVKDGELSEGLLPFLWANLCVGSPTEQEAHVQMLRTAGLLFVVQQSSAEGAAASGSAAAGAAATFAAPAPESSSSALPVLPPAASPDASLEAAYERERRWVMPMRLPLARPAAVDDLFPLRRMAKGDCQLSACFKWDELLPAGVAERAVAASQALNECHYRLYWRRGALCCVRAATVLLEVLQSSDGGGVLLSVSARGSGPDCWAVIKALCPRLKLLLEDSFRSLRVHSKLICPGCLGRGEWEAPHAWPLASVLAGASESKASGVRCFCEACAAEIHVDDPPRRLS